MFVTITTQVLNTYNTNSAQVQHDLSTSTIQDQLVANRFDVGLIYADSLPGFDYFHDSQEVICFLRCISTIIEVCRLTKRD